MSFPPRLPTPSHSPAGWRRRHANGWTAHVIWTPDGWHGRLYDNGEPLLTSGEDESAGRVREELDRLVANLPNHLGTTTRLLNVPNVRTLTARAIEAHVCSNECGSWELDD
jgi:hypothetical protein